MVAVLPGVFTTPAERPRTYAVELVFGPAVMPSSAEFTAGLHAFLDRLAQRHDLWLMVFPEEGDAPLKPQSFQKTHRSFDAGRWFSEVEARAVIADLAKNPSLRDLVFFQDDGLLIGTPKQDGFTPPRIARCLDRASDQHTTRTVLVDAAFVAWSVDTEFHLVANDPREAAWIKAALAG